MGRDFVLKPCMHVRLIISWIIHVAQVSLSFIIRFVSWFQGVFMDTLVVGAYQFFSVE